MKSNLKRKSFKNNYFDGKIPNKILGKVKIYLKIILTLYAVTNFVGCATNNIDTADTENNFELGKIVLFTEPTSIWQKTTNVGAVLIVVEDKEVGKLHFGQKSTLYLHPGQRFIKMYVNDSYPLVPVILKLNAEWANGLNVVKGETLFLRLKYQTGDYAVVGNSTVPLSGGMLIVETAFSEPSNTSQSFIYIEK